MRRAAKIAGIKIAGIVLAAALLAMLTLPFLIDVNDFRPRIESALTNALGRKVAVGNLKLTLLPVKVSADNLSVADDPAFSPAPFLQAREFSIGVELWPLILSKKLEITDLTIRNPAIVLLQAPSGKWNFSGLGSQSQSGASDIGLSAKLVKIIDGRLSISETGSGSKPQIIEQIQAEVQDFSSASALPFSFSAKVLSGGDINLQGQFGPLNRSDAAASPVQVTSKVTALRLAGSGFVDPASGIDGLLSMDGSASSNGSSLRWVGQMKLDEIRLARGGTPAREPVAFDYDVNHDLRSHSGVLNRGDIHVGKAAVSLTGKYALNNGATVLNLVLAGTKMPVSALVGMLPPLDIALPQGSSLQGGEIALNMNLSGPATSVVIRGPVGVTNTRLTGFDLGGKLSPVQALSGIKSSPNVDIQSLTADLRTASGGTTVENLKLVIPAMGQVDGAGTIGAGHALDFKMVATVSSAGLLSVALGQQGSMKVPFFVKGTSSNPVFTPDIQGIAAAELNRLQKGSLGKTAESVLDGLFGKRK